MQVTRVEVIPLKIGFKYERRIGRGVVGTAGPPLGTHVLVKVYTDEDVVGIGEVYPINPYQSETIGGVVAVIRDFYGPLLIGEDPFDVEKIMMKFDRYLPANTHARTVIELALHDIIGKFLKVPVYKLLGGLCWEKIPLEWSVAINTTERMIKESLDRMEQYGVKYLCIKVGPSERWKEDVKNVKEIRKAVGDDVVLAIDANGSYSPFTAIKAIEEMEKWDLYYAEQPVPEWDLEGMARVRHSVETAIMADEGVFTPQDAYKAIRMGAVDIICVKIPKPGGILGCKKIAAIAEAANIYVNLGSTMETGIGAAAGAHFYASTRNMCPAAEFILGLGMVQDDLLSEDTKFIIKDGYTEVPKRPGLGIEINEDAIEKFATAKYVVPQK